MHRTVCRAELDHVDARNGQELLEIINCLPFLDHQRAHGVILRLHPRRRPSLKNNTDVSLHPNAVNPLAAALARALGAGGLDTLLDILHRARVGEQ